MCTHMSMHCMHDHLFIYIYIYIYIYLYTHIFIHIFIAVDDAYFLKAWGGETERDFTLYQTPEDDALKSLSRH